VFQYARVWTDNFTFWSDVAGKAPQSALAQRQLALALLDRGQLDDTERALQRVLALPSDAEGRAMAYSTLGLTYRRAERFGDSIEAFESALRIAPHPALYHNLGMTLMAKAEQDQRQGDTASVGNDVRQARSAFEMALAAENAPDGQTYLQDWDPAKTHALLGQVLIALGDRAGARDHLQTALHLQPTGPVADVTRRQLEKLRP
jgi:tetratricopeptide (TPR) repeat protein